MQQTAAAAYVKALWTSCVPRPSTRQPGSPVWVASTRTRHACQTFGALTPSSLAPQICVRMTQLDVLDEAALSQIYQADMLMTLKPHAEAGADATATDFHEFMGECFNVGCLRLACKKYWRRLLTRSFRNVTGEDAMSCVVAVVEQPFNASPFLGLVLCWRLTSQESSTNMLHMRQTSG